MSATRKVLALNENARKQSVSGPATQETVTVAVLPPRLPPSMGEADGQGAAGAIDWDTNLNAQHNRLLPKSGETLTSRKRFLKKAGMTRDRKKAYEDMPPFRMRTVPYDVWRKHYAKDKDGNYMGTHAPAEDCLLKPEDVKKWSAEEPETWADTYTCGRRALPGYGDVKDTESSLPEYAEKAGGVQSGDITWEQKSEAPSGRQGSSGRTIDGKTTEQIIAEVSAREANKPRTGWRKLVS